ncbi:MAG: hypothetical protein HYZ21_11790 [Chloroflexi bacterium]|nr:hypothetical protein [Chloroflexota bacterium]
MTPENEIGILIDQTLTQDATGTLVMLELDSKELTFTVRHTLTPRLVEILFAGGLTNRIRHQSLVTA